MIPYAQKPAPEEEATVGRPRTGQMPLQHFRAPDDEWGVLGEVHGRHAHETLRALIRWHLRMPGAKMPERPSVEELDAARERYTVKQREKANRATRD